MTQRRGFLASLLGLIGLGTIKASQQQFSGTPVGKLHPVHSFPTFTNNDETGPIQIEGSDPRFRHDWRVSNLCVDGGRVVRKFEGVIEVPEPVSVTSFTNRVRRVIKDGWFQVRSEWQIDKTGTKIEYKIIDQCICPEKS